MNAEIQKTLDDFVTALRGALGDDVLSVVLFGSGAEDRLRPSSDVNVLVLLRRFEPAKAAPLAAPLHLFATAVRLRAMFVLEAELEAAALAFPVKFADMRRRHRVLAGPDPLQGLTIPRAALLNRLKQVLLNLALRLRSQLVEHGPREVLLVRTIADAAGPLRVCAAELLELEGRPTPSPKKALEIVVGKPLEAVSRAREDGELAPGTAAATLNELIEVAGAMRRRVEALG